MIFDDEVFSKEPLAPAVVDGDSRWAQAVDWAIFATIQAEEFGITSENVEGFDAGDDVNLQRFLGLEVEGDEGAAPLDPGLGLPPDYAVQVVSQVGNYGEIFEHQPRPARARARPQRAVDRRRPAVRPAVPLSDADDDRPEPCERRAPASGSRPAWPGNAHE